jgi:hypothetical protein
MTHRCKNSWVAEEPEFRHGSLVHARQRSPAAHANSFFSRGIILGYLDQIAQLSYL